MELKGMDIIITPRVETSYIKEDGWEKVDDTFNSYEAREIAQNIIDEGGRARVFFYKIPRGGNKFMEIYLIEKELI